MESISVYFENIGMDEQGSWPAVYEGIRGSLIITAQKHGFKSNVKPIQLFGADPVGGIPVEVIVSGIGAISIMIGALLGYLSKRHCGKIILQGKNGNSIEVPINTSKSDIDYYIKKSRELDADVIYLDVKLKEDNFNSS